MSDKQYVSKISGNTDTHFVVGFLFAILGLAFHPVFFIGTLCCLALAMRTRNQKIAMALLGAIFVIIAFGYGIGKDMAVRDNQAAANGQPETS